MMQISRLIQEYLIRDQEMGGAKGGGGYWTFAWLLDEGGGGRGQWEVGVRTSSATGEVGGGIR